ncbi:MAG: competence/damage-inducible protein A [Bdellovibrionaceae bacterium]|nr:competence/damage-inducible protein A [Pseudobdellovibrionaceae bacterium]
MNAAILTIGTEITSGEIVNGNAANLAQKLLDVYIETQIQLSVPDDKDLIVQACNYVKDQVDFIFFTGGLGPTSDDFTRDVIAEWTGNPLVFEQKIYDELDRNFKKMGRSLKTGHKQQCYFPEGSIIFPNSAGNALPFMLNTMNLKIFALPGPPLEIEAIWKDTLFDELCNLKLEAQKCLFKWKCFGNGESEFADLTEDIFKDSGFTLGYRATIPYVYIKVWVPKDKIKSKDKYFSEFETQMAEWIIKKDFFELLIEQFQYFSKIIIQDSVTEGKLLSQLMKAKNKEDLSKLEYIYTIGNYEQNTEHLKLSVNVHDESHWKAIAKWKNLDRVSLIKMPFNMNVYSQKSQLYITELVAKTWVDQIIELNHLAQQPTLV